MHCLSPLPYPFSCLTCPLQFLYLKKYSSSQKIENPCWKHKWPVYRMLFFTSRKYCLIGGPNVRLSKVRNYHIFPQREGDSLLWHTFPPSPTWDVSINFNECDWMIACSMGGLTSKGPWLSVNYWQSGRTVRIYKNFVCVYVHVQNNTSFSQKAQMTWSAKLLSNVMSA